MKEENAASYPFEYVIISGISILFFVIVILMSKSMLIDQPTRITAEGQFDDVGNNIGTKLVDFYLIVPTNGSLNTTLDMPPNINGHEYVVSLSVANQTDQRITITAYSLNINVSYTINGIGTSIPITGTTYSGQSEHRLKYRS